MNTTEHCIAEGRTLIAKSWGDKSPEGRLAHDFALRILAAKLIADPSNTIERMTLPGRPPGQVEIPYPRAYCPRTDGPTTPEQTTP